MTEELFSSVDLVSQCLIDIDKIRAFENAIKEKITAGSYVLDIGTGSGILALLLARNGAGNILALEFDPYIADIAKKNIEINKYFDLVKVLCGDARSYKFDSKPFDAITMEMLSTGMVDEYQVQAINNLHYQGLITSDTKLLPSNQETYIQLSHFDFSIDNFEMKMVRHLWKHNENRYLLSAYSEQNILNNIDFSQKINEEFSKKISIKVNKSGTINSIYFTSKTVLSEGISIDDTNSLNAPVVIPLRESLEVKENDIINLDISYKFGGGYNNFVINVI